jgi:hypothetical protein
MTFIPQTWTSPTDGLTDLEQRIKAAFDALGQQADALPRTAHAAVPAQATSSGVKVTLTWDRPFADTNYRIACSVEDAGDVPPWGSWFRRVWSKTPTDAVVQVNSSASTVAGQVTVSAIAVHD